MTNEIGCKQAIRWALDTGYRHFDTAQIYSNETFLGDALRDAGVQRSEVFITTKINPKNFGYDKTLRSFDDSLRNLQTDYVDLLLLHFPIPILRAKSWDALVEIQKQGNAKAIGVSNYTIRHIEGLAQHSGVLPSVNQVELHVFLQQPELLGYCANKGIRIEAYSPLAHGKGINQPVLTEIGQKYGKTPTQVMLRWCVEVGTIPLPKSTHEQRIVQNFEIFDFSLDKDDMKVIQGLNRNLRTMPNPKFIP